MKYRYNILALVIAAGVFAPLYYMQAAEKPLEKKGMDLFMQRETGFIENKGQVADHGGNPVPGVFFTASLEGMDVYVTETGLVYVFTEVEKEEKEGNKDKKGVLAGAGEKKSMTKYYRVDMKLVGGRVKKENVQMKDAVPGYYNYYLNHCPDGILNVREYKKVTVREVYPGIDWVLHGSHNKGFKYDFVVRPGADPRQIRMRYAGGEVAGQDNGKLRIITPPGILEEGSVVSYMDEPGRRKVSARFLTEGNDVRFEVDAYDRGKTLVIDPPMGLVWSTAYGTGNHDGPRAITMDNAGNIYLTGYGGATGFPSFTYNPGGSYYYEAVSAGSAWIWKFDTAGVRLWATMYGNAASSYSGEGITTDNNGNLFVAGTTQFDVPVQNPGGGAYYQTTMGGCCMMGSFILKFNSAGARQWATHYGGTTGSGNTMVRGCKTDATGNLYVTGQTDDSNFPTLNPGGGAYFQSAPAGGASMGVILKFNNAGVRQWATCYAGMDVGSSIATDASNNIYVVGYTGGGLSTYNPGSAWVDATMGGPADGAILKFSSSGTRLWATYFGGGGEEYAWGVATDGSSNVYVTGTTTSATGLPVLNPGGGAYYQSSCGGGCGGGASDIFIAKFNTANTRTWVTYYGGSGVEDENSWLYSNVISATPGGNVFVAATTYGATPTYNPGGGSYYRNALYGATGFNIFLMQFDAAGARLWATYFGGDGTFASGVAAVGSCVFVTGEWASTSSGGDFADPGVGNYYQTTTGSNDQGLIVKFCPLTPLPVEMLSFTGRHENGSNILEWATAPEINNTYFSVERGADGVNFETAGIVSGGKEQHYEFVDTYDYGDAGIVYYRLRMQDFDGQYGYSGVITVAVGGSPGRLAIRRILPDRLKQTADIDFFLPSGNRSELSVYDLMGNKVMARVLNDLPPGNNRVTMPVKELSGGMYHVKLSSDGRECTERMRIE